MSDKKSEIQNSSKLKTTIKEKDENDLYNFIEEKVTYIQEIIRNTISSIKIHKEHNIFSNNDANLSISVLTELYEKTNDVIKQLRGNNNKNGEKSIESLQKIIDKLSMIICGFGTKYIEDLLFIIFGTEFKNMKIENPSLNAKYEIIKNFVQPIGYKVVHWKPNKSTNTNNNTICSNKITEDTIVIEDSNTLECFDVDNSSKSFYQKIYGIRIVIQNEKSKKTLIINGIIDDIHINCFTNLYIKSRIHEIRSIANGQEQSEKEVIIRIIETITLKDILIFGNDDIRKKMIAIFTETNLVKQMKLENTIKKFLELDIYSQRNMLINLLINNVDDEIQYICYLLYDLITANSVDSATNSDQNFLYESLPWKIKIYFKDVVKHTIKYTNDMMQKYEINKVSLEQQIYLLKANENVKEKAMAKLKEIKGKPDELSTKAKQYLEGLIKIPFGIYREEPILKKMKEVNKWFIRTITLIEQLFPELKITKKEKYSNVEIANSISKINAHINEKILTGMGAIIDKNSNKQLTKVLQYVNTIKKSKGEKKFSLTNASKPENFNRLLEYVNNNSANESIVTEVFDQLNISSPISLTKTKTEISSLTTNISNIETAMKNIVDVLDESIYGHSHAKNQLLKIIAQWMNGE